MVREHVQRMLQAVNLDGFIDRQTHTLSGGQKQRVAIAGALAQCPKVHSFVALVIFFEWAVLMPCGIHLRVSWRRAPKSNFLVAIGQQEQCEGNVACIKA